MLLPRISKVNNVSIATVNIASIFEIGDTANIYPEAIVFALQREYPIFYGHEGSLDYFSAFNIPLLKTNIYERVEENHVNEEPIINVGQLNIIGISTASHVQIGSTQNIYTQARVYNVRHFFDYPEGYPRSIFYHGFQSRV